MCRSKVGDRYVLEMLQERGGTLGGETSGHIICLDRVTSGDGIVSALQVLHAIREGNTTLNRITQGMRKYPQILINVRLPREMDVVSLPRVEDSVSKAEAELGEHGRVLLRPSGTEPLVRVMVEGHDLSQVQRIARQIAADVEKAIDAGS